MENTNFFDRIVEIMNYYKIKSVNALAKKHLGYKSSEKISRLRRESANPSLEIITDITNKFEEISLEWLITGSGEMLSKDNNKNKETNIPAESEFEYPSLTKELIKELSIKNEQLRIKDEQISKLLNIINDKIYRSANE